MPFLKAKPNAIKPFDESKYYIRNLQGYLNVFYPFDFCFSMKMNAFLFVDEISTEMVTDAVDSFIKSARKGSHTVDSIRYITQ